MKVANLATERYKETPSECVIDSHIFMVRGGYIKNVASGIYTLLPPMKRIAMKIENIIRAEMDATDNQEVLFPVVLPGSLWDESGRYESVGKELLRFNDRNGAAMVLGMTHEEAAVHAVKDYATTYQRYPFKIYQIQTKFRDEARPRAGLIRVREFTMKDAYSFHTSQADLDVHYQIYFDSYERIYRRVGLDVISVASDNGMMGGSISHEFMYLTPVGEDSIALCTACDYRANVEAAENILPPSNETSTKEIEKVFTPDKSTIEAVCEFLNSDEAHSIKAVVYQKESDDALVLLFLRGDLEVNETKLTNYLGDNVYPAALDENSPIVAGFIGPVNLDAPEVTVLFDNSLKDAVDLVCGANEKDYHYTGVTPARDLSDVEYHDFAKVTEGGICPVCGQPAITISRGIEVGNIFQLGTKYSEPMGLRYTDENGQDQVPIMGSYGIGVGRLAASVIEEHHDEYGPIWPMSIAPWQVQICCMRADNEEVRAAADNLYRDLTRAGVEVLYDDRSVSAGVMFSDADLFGIPLRVVASPRNQKTAEFEFSTRDKSFKEMIPQDGAVDIIQDKIDELMEQYK